MLGDVMCSAAAQHASTHRRDVCILFWSVRSIMLMLVINKKWHHLLHPVPARSVLDICLLQHCNDRQLFNNPPSE